MFEINSRASLIFLLSAHPIYSSVMCFVPTKYQAPCLGKAIEKKKQNKNPVMAYEVVVECMNEQNGTNDIMGEVE